MEVHLLSKRESHSLTYGSNVCFPFRVIPVEMHAL